MFRAGKVLRVFARSNIRWTLINHPIWRYHQRHCTTITRDESLDHLKDNVTEKDLRELIEGGEYETALQYMDDSDLRINEIFVENAYNDGKMDVLNQFMATQSPEFQEFYQFQISLLSGKHQEAFEVIRKQEPHDRYLIILLRYYVRNNLFEEVETLFRLILDTRAMSNALLFPLIRVAVHSHKRERFEFLYSLVDHQKSDIINRYLINFFSSIKDYKQVIKIFKTMKQHGQEVTSENYHCLVTCYLEKGKLEDAMVLLSRLTKSGMSIQDKTYLNLVTSLAKSDPKRAESYIHQMRASGMRVNCSVYITLTRKAVQNQDYPRAYALFEILMEHPELPSVNTFYLTCYKFFPTGAIAEDAYRRLKGLDIEVTEQEFCNIIFQRYCEEENDKKVEEWFNYIANNNLTNNLSLFTYVRYCVDKHNRTVQALEDVFAKIMKKTPKITVEAGLFYRIATRSTIIDSYEKAQAIMRLVQSNGLVLEERLCAAIFDRLASYFYSPDKCWDFICEYHSKFSSKSLCAMVDNLRFRKIQPPIQLIYSLADSYLNDGMTEAAGVLLLDNNLSIDREIYITVLKQLLEEGNTVFAQKIIHRMNVVQYDIPSEFLTRAHSGKYNSRARTVFSPIQPVVLKE